MQTPKEKEIFQSYNNVNISTRKIGNGRQNLLYTPTNILLEADKFGFHIDSSLVNKKVTKRLWTCSAFHK